jgi:nucleoside-diphosphate-sugar epimerase
MTRTSSSVLVTGGMGVLGRSIVRGLVAEGRSVRVLSRGASYPEHPQVSTYHGDLTCRDDLRGAIQGCNAVFHCAAEKSDRTKMRAVNVSATRSLLELARESGVTYFCHLSSVGVIGKTRVRLVDESARCNPRNAYEQTKLAAEEIVRQGIDDGRVLILRPTNVFSATTLEPWLERSFRRRVRLFLKGNENAHLVYVEDVAAAALHGLRLSSGPRVDTFIVSSDEETGSTYSEVQAELATRVSGAPRPFRLSAPAIVPYCARLVAHRDTNFGNIRYSSGKLRRTGFCFPYGLKNGLIDAVNQMCSRAVAG